MSNSAKILWLEEDYLDVFEAAIIDMGYILKRAFFISDAIHILKEENIDLLLLDVMIPIEEEDVKLGYTDENTKGGNLSGLEFYRKNIDKLNKLKIPVLVYTICGNMEDVKREFIKLGLKSINYMDKVTSSNVNDLLLNIERIIKENRIKK